MTQQQQDKTFALIGAAGYVAPRHMEAIKAVGGELIVAMDPNDHVGFMDAHFPDAFFYKEFERFDRYVDQCNRHGRPINYISICSPDYMHDSHIRYALRAGADVICEKPLVLDLWNLDGLEKLEQETGCKVNVVLQLRLHREILELKKQMEAAPDTMHDIDLTYITPRGRWFQASWKGDETKSGGIATTIGIHFFDMLQLLFGQPSLNVMHLRGPTRAAGYMEMKRARVRWYLSIDRNDLPPGSPPHSPYRAIRLDGRDVEFSDGFGELHTAIYRAAMEGKGFGINEARASIEIVSVIRKIDLKPNMGEQHAFARRHL